MGPMFYFNNRLTMSLSSNNKFYHLMLIALGLDTSVLRTLHNPFDNTEW